MSALAMRLTGAMGIPGNAPQMVAGEVEQALPPDSFERFCHYFLAKCSPGAAVHRPGGSRHAQDGVDVEITFPDSKCFSFQCNHVGECGPAKVRAAVTSHKRKAVKKFLLLMRVASPQARDAGAKFRGWDIWDKEDISRPIREFANQEQRHQVRRFHPPPDERS